MTCEEEMILLVHASLKTYMCVGKKKIVLFSPLFARSSPPYILSEIKFYDLTNHCQHFWSKLCNNVLCGHDSKIPV